MESVESGVVAHGPDPVLKPPIEFVAQNGGQLAVVIRETKDRIRTETLVLAVDVNERKDGSHRTDQRILSGGQGNLVDSFSELVVLRFVDFYEDTGVHVVVQGRDVLPAQDHLEIHRLGGLRDQVGTAKHGQVVDDAKRFVDGKCVMVQKRGVRRNLCEE